ncbi:MAG: hypothetical protein B7Y25_03755 [Alphaproteobacteria bacterium 16-39-46]|nr:MAG: hypothetical protein B7Y25_03755 [Alphaproteobacteria bacterium 16-39-46]OZA43167.1 MAG: hypothetical protein B7X84_03980 [Alphaproteobacteria bacterium 17-39-52]HQS84015.1 hypothetical protein [Alphaproteobacteria bacterium]HQS93895.1 hypothetical protein [Alphaproteobacteria bacterium]
MKLSKIFKLSTTLGILGSLFLSGSSYGMEWQDYEFNVIEGRPILTVVTQTVVPGSEEAKNSFRTLLPGITATQMEALFTTTKETDHDIGSAPIELEDQFDIIFNLLVQSVKLPSGGNVKLVPLRGGKEEFLAWCFDPFSKLKRFHPRVFLKAFNDRMRFLRDGLSTFCHIIKSNHVLQGDTVVSTEQTCCHVSLTSFKGFSAENPLDGFKSGKDHLSGLAWWIIKDEVTVGCVQANIVNFLKETPERVPLQAIFEIGIFPRVDFTSQDEEALGDFFEEKIREVKGSGFSVPCLCQEEGRDFLLTENYRFVKIPSVDTRYRPGVEIHITNGKFDVSPQMYPEQMGRFKRIFGLLEGEHELSAGKTITLTPLVGGRQFEQFGHFFGPNPSVAAENFAKALQVRNDFFEKELRFILELPLVSGESRLMSVNTTSRMIPGGIAGCYGEILLQRTNFDGLMWLVQTEDGEPMGTVRVNHNTNSLKRVSLLDDCYDPVYSLSFSLAGHLSDTLDMDFNKVREELFNIFESKWWSHFKAAIKEMPNL